MIAVQCQQCGGAVASPPGKEHPACLFCGSMALIPTDPDDDLEPPEGWLPFVTDRTEADAAFRTFASSSFWYPNAIKAARVELRRLLLPAWAWTGDLETHWTGLVRAATQSGKRPVAGEAAAHFDQVLIPASATLAVKELRGLGRYDEGPLTPWREGDGDAPMEISELTRDAAREKAVDEMEARHATALAAQHSLLSHHTAALASSLAGKPVLVPVWIGVYRHRDIAYRVLVNGQTGVTVGEAPTSWLKVALVSLAVVTAIAAIIAAIAMVAS